MMQSLLDHIKQGDAKSLARAISIIENEAKGYEQLLLSLNQNQEIKVIGITGAPGVGKSTLTDALISVLINEGKKIGVLCIDPSSPFNLGALLGDRIRMSEWYNHPNVFIRSLASRGNLGGLNPKIIEITELMKTALFDYIIIETVGVGQSEIEIAGLADTTIVMLVPEGGDEIQTMKAGIMEVADIFVVNKSDRPDADMYIKNLRQMLAPAFSRQHKEIPIVKTIAQEKKGIEDLLKAIKDQETKQQFNEKKLWLFTERAYQLIQNKRMKDVDKMSLKTRIKEENERKTFNLYQFVQQYN
jgi:LAO/AO transport system kinase